jgi:hypothetical protein
LQANVEFYLCHNGPNGFAIFIAPRASATPPDQLPTGGHSQGVCARCVYTQQAELYARDLAYLLPRRPVGAGLSDEEHAYLSHITTRERSQDSN